MKHLPAPEVVSSYFDEAFTPLLGAMELHWPDEPELSRASLWQLPTGVRLIDTLPRWFGVRILRTNDDVYEVCLLWNHVALRWTDARRADLLQSSLQPILASLGTDLAHLLDQPVLVPLKLAA
jgi:hypothetical protein